MSEEPGNVSGSEPRQTVVHGCTKGFAQEITVGEHRLAADEPKGLGGTDTAPGPYDLLLSALGACTSMTVSLYARRKQWPLQEITVSLHHSRIHATDCSECETKNGMLDRIEAEVELSGPLTPEERSKLMEIAGKCPVHRTLKSQIDIQIRPKGDQAEKAH